MRKKSNLKRAAAVIMVSALLGTTVFAGFEDVQQTGEYAEAIGHLSTYGIFSGTGENQFSPDKPLTRSEFAKIAVIADGIKNTAIDGRASLFSDIAEGYWANPYINTAAKNGILTGYPDGTFMPEKQVTYAETVTVILRLLDYTAADLGQDWPNAYLEKAAQIGITEGMDFLADDYTDRKNAALMLDRALYTDMNTDSYKKTKLIEKLDYTLSDECVILATNEEDRQLLSDEVSTSDGIYKMINGNARGYSSQKVKFILNTENKIVCVLPLTQKGETIAVREITGNDIAYRKNGVTETLKMDDHDVVYYNLQKSTFGEVKENITAGTEMIICRDTDGRYDYSLIREHEWDGPEIISGSPNDLSYPVEHDTLRVVRDGEESSWSALRKDDVVYYDRYANTIYAYCDKVTGVYTEAYPNKADASSVKISDEIYGLETVQAKKQIAAYGFNEYVTVLLGKDGDVAAVQEKESTGGTDEYGIILSCGERVSTDRETKGKKQFYITCLTVSGRQQEFETDKDYSDKRGRTVRYEFENGMMKPQFVKGSTVSGTLDMVNKRIGDTWISDDCELIDLLYAPEDDETADAKAKKIELSDLTVPELKLSDIVYAQKDEDGNLSLIVFNNITMDRYRYGIVTELKNGLYTLDIDGRESVYSMDKKSTAVKGTPVMANIQSNALLELKELYHIKTSGKFNTMDKQKINIGGTNYRVSDDVTVYVAYKDGKTYYKTISINEISQYHTDKIQIYTDRQPAKGGLVRVVVLDTTM